MLEGFYIWDFATIFGGSVHPNQQIGAGSHTQSWLCDIDLWAEETWQSRCFATRSLSTLRQYCQWFVNGSSIYLWVRQPLYEVSLYIVRTIDEPLTNHWQYWRTIDKLLTITLRKTMTELMPIILDPNLVLQTECQWPVSIGRYWFDSHASVCFIVPCVCSKLLYPQEAMPTRTSREAGSQTPSSGHCGFSVCCS